LSSQSHADTDHDDLLILCVFIPVIGSKITVLSCKKILCATLRSYMPLYYQGPQSLEVSTIQATGGSREISKRVFPLVAGSDD
jgi:hypothetical protein